MPDSDAGRRRRLRWGGGILAVGLVAGGIAGFLTSGRARPGGGPPPPRAGGASEVAGDERPLQGGRIVFAGARQGRRHIHIINSDGSQEAILTSGPGQDHAPAWSPDRQRIAFVRTQGPIGSASVEDDLYIVGVDGSEPIRLTDGPEAEGDPSWAPGGLRIVFAEADPSTGRIRMAVVNVDGTKATPLPEPPPGCSDREPDWSPDGETIVFARKCGEEPSALFLMRVDGTGLERLSKFGRTPDWSPDGTKIAFTGLGIVGPAVVIINPDGTGRILVTSDYSGDPVWSPDGSRLAFTVSDPLGPKLYIINVDGTGAKRLTQGTSEEVTPSW